MKAYAIKSIGECKGAPRIWIEGNQPARVGFTPGARYTVMVDTERRMLRLELNDGGERIVSRKARGAKEIPIIDLNNRDLASLFDGLESVRVIYQDKSIFLLPRATDLRKQERVKRLRDKIARGEPLQVGSISHGGGVLSSALHAGLTDEGVTSQLAFANEIREVMLEQASTVNEVWGAMTQALEAPIQELMADKYAVARMPVVDILEAGLPCSGASVAGRAKRGLGMPEEHPEVGHLVHPFLTAVESTNPAIVVLENVTQYQNTASAAIIRTHLRDMGYDVYETILDASEWNCMEERKRLCLVAVTQGLTFDFAELDKPERAVRRLGEILEDMALDDPRWSLMPGLKAKAIRDKAEGKGFEMQIFDAASPNIKTLTKGIAKNRSTDPKIRHPENPEMLRIPTAREHARAKGVPEHLIEGMSSTAAHELLGQSVCYDPFRAVGRLLGRACKRKEVATPVAEFQLAA